VARRGTLRLPCKSATFLARLCIFCGLPRSTIPPYLPTTVFCWRIRQGVMPVPYCTEAAVTVSDRLGETLVQGYLHQSSQVCLPASIINSNIYDCQSSVPFLLHMRPGAISDIEPSRLLHSHGRINRGATHPPGSTPTLVCFQLFTEKHYYRPVAFGARSDFSAGLIDALSVRF
jgi:hypothetical protein